MLFVDVSFFIFFGTVLSVYWSLPSNQDRKLFLLLSSYYFYGFWDWRFVVLLMLLSSADFFLARRIASATEDRERLLFVSLSVTINLAVLGFFKYFGFFTDSAVRLAHQLGFQVSQPTLHIILPIGISFFTFQSLSYTLDVYRRKIEPVRHLRDYLLFAAFFPQLVAGPIVRAHFFLPQLQEKRVETAGTVQSLLALFLIGYFKKTCIADNISPFVDRVFDAPTSYDGLSSITAVWLYATQIYCDFSGYTDMAIAVAGLMGFRLTINFDAPYLSRSIQEFWRRWHISLSTWIRDYIYLSLGGRSKVRFLTYRNLVVTMLIGGLWHGAAWTFVLWGGLHGMALTLQQEFRQHFPAGEIPSPVRGAIGWFLTLNFVCVGWILFRAPGFDSAVILTKKYLLIDRDGSATLPLWLFAFGPALLAVQYLMRRFNVMDHFTRLDSIPFAMAYGAVWAVTLALLPLGYRPFIYFQF